MLPAKKILAAVLIGLMTLCFAAPSLAQGSQVGVGVKAGTLGVGVDLTIGISDHFNFRVQLSGLPKVQLYSATISDIDYDYSQSHFALGAMLDWFPMSGASFRITVGFFLNNSEVEVEASTNPTDTYQIGGVTFFGAQLGDISGSGNYNSVAPYVGIGFGNALDKDGNWQFSLDAGVLWQGSADIELTADNPFNSPVVDAAMQAEEDKVQEEADRYQFYPVIMLGVTYKF